MTRTTGDRIRADCPAFPSDKYFFPRPSAVDYKADATGGSNLGTKNPDLRKKIIERAQALKATDQIPVPVDLVTASGGGLDPHISPEAAFYQAGRVAAARGLSIEDVQSLIDEHIERSGSDHRGPAEGECSAAQPGSRWAPSEREDDSGAVSFKLSQPC